MRLLLLANDRVGLEISRFLLKFYPDDLGLVVTLGENDIFHICRAAGRMTRVFDSDEALVAYLYNNKTQIDLGVLAWWPTIIKAPLRDLPRLGFVNTHPSLLPYNRGKHYNFWAIVEEAPFGVTLHRVDDGIDSGDILAQKNISYDWQDNGETLYWRAQCAMVDLFRNTYPKLRECKLKGCPQNLEKGSFHKADELEHASRINLDMMYTARELLNLLRAKTFEGHSGCWFEDNGIRYEVRVDIRRVDK